MNALQILLLPLQPVVHARNYPKIQNQMYLKLLVFLVGPQNDRLFTSTNGQENPQLPLS